MRPRLTPLLVELFACVLIVLVSIASAGQLFGERGAAQLTTSSSPTTKIIPAQAARYRADLTRCARVHWGLDAPVATFAAQIHQESRWRADAKSPVGAQGLTQFMPATARWMGNIDPELADAQPYNPGWALRALAAYDHWLWERVEASTPCDRMAMTLSAYNGGLGWVGKDKALARKRGADPLEWFDSVERFNAGRNPAAYKENRGYPRRILLELEPVYATAGWGRGVCRVR
ncbi:MAG: transglycosylase SLT domain-containing protein [Desulfovibrio sp.]|nr:transglycosylase SLT domain-containing protein [Desulfovibrio sp.]MBI4960402.1 transglycosylase SLT domain-containing protein [Desulfovibrio sp.]